MADLSQTIINTVGFIGTGPTNKWGEFLWGDNNWGEGDIDIPQDIAHGITDSTALTSTTDDKNVGMGLSNSTALTSAIIKDTTQVMIQTLLSVGDMGSEQLGAGGIWTYVLPGPTTEGESRSLTDWTEVT